METESHDASRTTLRSRLAGAASVVAPIAAIGAVLSGLAGYLSAWSTLKSVFFRVERPIASAPDAMIVSKGPTVLVAAFANETGDPSASGIAGRLTRATIADLSKFDQLRVVGAPWNGADVRMRPSADYIVEGELTGKADPLRAALRLVNAKTGAQVWSKTFEAQAGAEGQISVEDQIAGRAAAIIGSWQGRVSFDEYPSIVAKPLASLTSYECIVQGVMVSQRPLPDSVMRARTCLDALVVREPANADAWSGLAAVLYLQRLNGLGLRPDEAGNAEKRAYLANMALDAASRAVALAPDRSIARRTLGLSYSVKCDRDHLREETRRAIELNPNDPMNFGILGSAIMHVGDFEDGGALMEKGVAMLGADAPRWWYAELALRDFARGDFRRAYDHVLKGYYEGFVQSYLYMTLALTGLGRGDAAKAEISKLLKAHPGFTLREADAGLRSLCANDARRERTLNILREAGLPE
jgi:TolB-like protein/tetratricopeptide (TPR) repeat protein